MLRLKTTRNIYLIFCSGLLSVLVLDTSQATELGTIRILTLIDHKKVFKINHHFTLISSSVVTRLSHLLLIKVKYTINI